MNRERFEHLLDAYGADFRRWPADERTAGEAFAVQHADETAPALAAARTLDGALDAVRIDLPEPELLAKRIMAKAPKPARGLDLRVGWALAACAVFGVVVGYGGGMLAPTVDADDSYFVMAFEAPFAGGGDEG